MNRVILIGNLVRDPESRTTPSGINYCTFILAINRPYTDKGSGKREADYINIVAWRGTADLCARYLSKGRKAAIVGTIQTRSYDAQDGGKRYVTEVIADDVEFLTPRDAQQPRQDTRYAHAPQREQTRMDYYPQPDEDELPF